MGHLETEFLKTEISTKLAHRQEGFLAMLRHLDQLPVELRKIVETGTARIRDNWGGDGQSTLIWDWVCSQCPTYVATSIDLDPNAVAVAMSQTKHVDVREGDSVTFLATFERAHEIGLLYLDSFDWSPEIALDSAFHHLAELSTVWARLPSGCMIVVDDRHAEFAGKHFMIQFFMEKLGIAPAFVGYQIGWVKP